MAFIWTLSPLKLLKVTPLWTGPVPQVSLLPVPPALSNPRIRVLTVLLLTPLNSNLGRVKWRLVASKLACFNRAYLKSLTPSTPWSPLSSNGKKGLKVTVRPVANRKETQTTAPICLGLAPIIPYGLSLVTHPPLTCVRPTVLPRVLWNPKILSNLLIPVPILPNLLRARWLQLASLLYLGIIFLQHPRASRKVWPIKPLQIVINLPPPCVRKLP